MDESRRRLLIRGLGVALVGVGAWIFVVPTVPRAQTLRFHLGAGSTKVRRVTARIAQGASWDRETTFQFASGAPPSFDWSFELPNGKARVEIELHTPSSTADRKWEILLGGAELTVDLVDTMRGLP
ncbi:MAG: hypothetical protein JNL79_18880 [Myxococcales bacterium]|nr:hypothetical protein [Myxococcales bacterium]